MMKLFTVLGMVVAVVGILVYRWMRDYGWGE